MDAFLEYMSGKRQSVSAQLSSSYAAQVEHNRKVLRSVIATIELCGRQGLALRGHRDDLQHLDDVNNNPGNFYALLKFRCDAGDNILEEHLKGCAKNASYRSKTTQNEVLGGINIM